MDLEGSVEESFGRKEGGTQKGNAAVRPQKRICRAIQDVETGRT